MPEEKKKRDEKQLSDDELEDVSGGTGDDMIQGTGGGRDKGGLELPDPPGGN